MRTLLLVFGTVFLALAAAAAAESHKVTLFYPSFVGETELRTGDCKLMIEDSRVVIQQGRKKVEADVKVESTGEKNKTTIVRYDNGDGKYRISEIRLGGTDTKLVFN